MMQMKAHPYADTNRIRFNGFTLSLR